MSERSGMQPGASPLRRELLTLVGVVLAALVPFADTAFNIDEPLFLWTARHLQSHPFDFYGFNVNWYGNEMPMHLVTKNPPLAAYYLAAAAALLGWGEVGLHLAFLLPAAGAAVGTYLLARRLCSGALEAALLAVFTPAFLVSSSSVMSDVLMLAFWCGAVVCWIRGLDQQRWPPLLAGALLAGLASLTKYYAVALVPLLFAYGVLRTRGVGRWALWLLLPLLALLGYELLTHGLYGLGLLGEAAFYSAKFHETRPVAPPQRLMVGLAFAGGCLAPALFYAPLLWSARFLALAFALVALGLLALGTTSAGGIAFDEAYRLAWPRAAQFLAMGVGGVSLLALACAELRRRSAESWLLGLWVLGTFVFASFVNWDNNARSNLPMAPAMGILLVRRLELRRTPRSARWERVCAAPAVLLAILVTWGDATWANQVRLTAGRIGRIYVSDDRTTYFVGHWGFQYYIEPEGARAMDLGRDVAEVGQLLVVPINNAQAPMPYAHVVSPVAKIGHRRSPWLQTMSHGVAGFYSSQVGPLPFVIMNDRPDLYWVLSVKKRFTFLGDEILDGSGRTRRRPHRVWLPGVRTRGTRGSPPAEGARTPRGSATEASPAPGPSVPSPTGAP